MFIELQIFCSSRVCTALYERETDGVRSLLWQWRMKQKSVAAAAADECSLHNSSHLQKYAKSGATLERILLCGWFCANKIGFRCLWRPLCSPSITLPLVYTPLPLLGRTVQFRNASINRCLIEFIKAVLLPFKPRCPATVDAGLTWIKRLWRLLNLSGLVDFNNLFLSKGDFSVVVQA